MENVLSHADPPLQKVSVAITGHFEDVDIAANAVINCHKEQFNKFQLEDTSNSEPDDEYTATIVFTKKDPSIESHIRSILSDHMNIKFSIEVMEGTNDEGVVDA